MRIDSLRDLYVMKLIDLYDAEGQIIKSMPKIAKATASEALRAAFQTHYDQTVQQVERLEQLMRYHNIQAARVSDRGMLGILQEGEEIALADGDHHARDAGILAAAQQVEHYEIAGYGTAVAYARQLGDSEGLALLEQTLKEEIETDQILSRLAEQHLNVRADQPESSYSN